MAEPCRPPMTNVGTETAFRHDHSKHFQNWSKLSKNVEPPVIACYWYFNTSTFFELRYGNEAATLQSTETWIMKEITHLATKNTLHIVTLKFHAIASWSTLLCLTLQRPGQATDGTCVDCLEAFLIILSYLSVCSLLCCYMIGLVFWTQSIASFYREGKLDLQGKWSSQLFFCRRNSRDFFFVWGRIPLLEFLVTYFCTIM